jgi:hypothetical protein
MRIGLSLFKTVFETYVYDGAEHKSIVTSIDVASRDGFNDFRQIADIKRAADLKPIVDEFAAKAKTAFPNRSFSIYIKPARGERKPPGFDKLVDDRKEDPLGLYRHVQTIHGRNASMRSELLA